MGAFFWQFLRKIIHIILNTFCIFICPNIYQKGICVIFDFLYPSCGFIDTNLAKRCFQYVHIPR